MAKNKEKDEIIEETAENVETVEAEEVEAVDETGV